MVVNEDINKIVCGVAHIWSSESIEIFFIQTPPAISSFIDHCVVKLLAIKCEIVANRIVQVKPFFSVTYVIFCFWTALE